MEVGREGGRGMWKAKGEREEGGRRVKIKLNNTDFSRINNPLDQNERKAKYITKHTTSNT